MAENLVRSMPCNVEAEQYVLGAVIFDNDCIGDILEKLRVDDFYLEPHKKIYSAMMDLSNSSKPVDLITLKSELGGNFDSVGGIEYLTRISLTVSTTANLGHYIQIIKDKSVLRKLIKATSEINDIAYGGDQELGMVLNSAESKLFDVLQVRTTQDLVPIREILKTNLEQIENLIKNKSKITGVPTGFAELDKRMAGLQPSDLILVAARPGMGKTSFALNIATHAAIHHNIPVAIFSLEMSKEQLSTRILCSESYISSEKMRVGDLGPEEIPKLVQTAEMLSKAPIYIDDTPGITMSEIRSKCRRLKLKNQLGIVIVDYLQLMLGSGKGNRQEDVADNSRMLKILAKELNVPVITLSQLSRAPEQRSDHRPVLSDLRESGSIEQDADIVMFLYREDKYDENTDKKNIAECIISKFRNGAPGTVELGWRGEFTRFMNLDKNR
ncbi:MAG: replicative DNA helicase [Ruminococcaceae bacterium]|nr:replicative DNA helicase [Oscillospiraceae bacterium]